IVHLPAGEVYVARPGVRHLEPVGSVTPAAAGGIDFGDEHRRHRAVLQRFDVPIPGPAFPRFRVPAREANGAEKALDPTAMKMDGHGLATPWLEDVRGRRTMEEG